MPRHAGRLGKLALGAVTALAMLAIEPVALSQATAASCAALASQLARAGGARKDRSKANRYSKAVARQKRELSRTRAMARRAGCRASAGGGRCGSLNDTIRRMEKRVAELEAKRRAASGGSAGRRSRRSIEAQMRRQGCSASRTRSAARNAKPQKVERVARAEPTARGPASVSRPSLQAPVGGGYRTMCVRTCDGYYFPVSNAIDPRGFRADAARCASMCPAAETKLFVHHRSGDAQSMVDRVGRRYSSMPYAFRHQQPEYKHTKSCTCGRPLAPRPKMTELRGAQQTAPAEPLGIAARASDGETVRNAGLNFGWRSATELVARGRATEAAPRRIRVVGPKFLPDP